jgi:hypothetical protein
MGRERRKFTEQQQGAFDELIVIFNESISELGTHLSELALQIDNRNGQLRDTAYKDVPTDAGVYLEDDYYVVCDPVKPIPPEIAELVQQENLAGVAELMAKALLEKVSQKRQKIRRERKVAFERFMRTQYLSVPPKDKIIILTSGYYLKEDDDETV